MTLVERFFSDSIRPPVRGIAATGVEEAALLAGAAAAAEGAAAAGTTAAGTAAAAAPAVATGAGAAGAGTAAGLGGTAALTGAELGTAGALTGAGAGGTAAGTATGAGLTAAELTAPEIVALGGEGLAGGAAEGVGAGASTEAATPMTFELSLDTTVPDLALSYEQAADPIMQFQSPGALSNPSGMYGPEGFLGAESGGTTAVSPTSDPTSASWLNWLNKDNLQTATAGTTLASLGKQLAFPPSSGPARPSPMASQPSASPYRGPTSDLMVKLLEQRMGGRRTPPLTFR